MFWAVLVPIYFVGVTGRTFPEIPERTGARRRSTKLTAFTRANPVMLSFDYDPPQLPKAS